MECAPANRLAVDGYWLMSRRAFVEAPGPTGDFSGKASWRAGQRLRCLNFGDSAWRCGPLNEGLEEPAGRVRPDKPWMLTSFSREAGVRSALTARSRQPRVPFSRDERFGAS